MSSSVSGLSAALHRFGPVLPVVLLIAVLGLPTAGTDGSGGAGGLAGIGGLGGLAGLVRFDGTGGTGALAGLPGLPGLGGGGGAGGAVGGGATVADAVSALVVLYAVLQSARHRRRPLTRTAAVVLGLPVIGLAVAATGAGDTVTGLAGFARYAQVFVLVPAAVVLLVRDRADLRLVAWAFTGLALWQGGLGVHQYVTGTGASYMGSDIRAVGTFGPTDVMGMATVVAYGLVCAAGIALAPGGRPFGAGRRERAVALVCALLLVVPLALSFSRGAWIATAVACGAQLALAGPRPAVKVCVTLTAAAVVLVGGMGVGTSMLEERLESITHVTDAPDQSVADRYTLWAAAVGMWRERPVTGVGLKGFPAYRDSRASLALSSGSDTEGAGVAFHRRPLLSPHNMYLLVLSEQGLLGLMGLAGGWAALLVCGARRGVLTRYGTRAGRADLTEAGQAVAERPKADQPGAVSRGWRQETHGGHRGHSRRRLPGADCALIACGLLVWQLADFVYADIGGPSTVLTGAVLGVGAWWALGTTADTDETSGSVRADGASGHTAAPAASVGAAAAPGGKTAMR